MLEICVPPRPNTTFQNVFPVLAKHVLTHVTFNQRDVCLLGRFGNYHPAQAKRQFLPIPNSCCLSETDAVYVQQRVAPKSGTSGLIKCTLGNIETIGKTSNKTSNSWEQAWTKLYHALETSSDPCPLWATSDLTTVTSR